jgi:hypothetical protein
MNKKREKQQSIKYILKRFYHLPRKHGPLQGETKKKIQTMAITFLRSSEAKP